MLNSTRSAPAHARWCRCVLPACRPSFQRYRCRPTGRPATGFVEVTTFQVVVRPTGTDPAEARLNRPIGDRSRTQQRDPAAEKALEHVGSNFLQWLRLHRRVSPVAFHDKWPSLTPLMTAGALRRHLPAIAGTAKIGPVSSLVGCAHAGDRANYRRAVSSCRRNTAANCWY